jgi:membrane protease YdiL (CAAX protease family)
MNHPDDANWHRDPAGSGGIPVPERSEARVFPLAALWVALAGLIGGLFIAVLLTLPIVLLWEDADAVAGAAAMLGLYVGFAAAGWVASIQWGTGRPLADLGVRFRRADLGWGPVAALGALTVTVALALAFSLVPDLEGTNTEFVERQASTGAGVVMVLLATTIGAPIFEEIFFRGLVLRALRSRMSAPPAVTLQALLFGLVHVQAGQGLGTISVVAATAAIGAVLGVAATVSGRLGPGMIGHALFNGVVVTSVLLGPGT